MIRIAFIINLICFGLLMFAYYDPIPRQTKMPEDYAEWHQLEMQAAEDAAEQANKPAKPKHHVKIKMPRLPRVEMAKADVIGDMIRRNP